MTDDEKNLFFIHVPSCGGTTFWTILRARYGKERVVRFGTRQGDAERFLAIEDAPAHFADKAVVGGHLTLRRSLTQLPDRRRITFLRHPVSRAFSVYARRVRNAKWTPDRALGEADILRYFRESAQDVLFRRYFSAGEGRSVEQACRGLEDLVDVVGITEEFDRSLLVLANRLGWGEAPTYDRHNIGGNKPPERDPAVVEELTEMLADEIAVYDHGVALFRRACAEMPGDLDAQLAAFQAANREREAAMRARNLGRNPYVKRAGLAGAVRRLRKRLRR